jgi:two-component system chemotaxis sensor kinase CheA
VLLEALLDPLLHALRNALHHGLEPAAQRRAAGKPARGSVRVTAQWRAEDLCVTLADDGRGIDVAGVKRAAIARGLIEPDEAARMAEREALLLCLLPGLSTSPTLTTISGRGVGLDALLAAVERLGGRVELQSRPGAGTCVTLTIPGAASLAGPLPQLAPAP